MFSQLFVVTASSSLPPQQPLTAVSGQFRGTAGLQEPPACFSPLRSKLQVSPAAITGSKLALVCVQNGCLVLAFSTDRPRVGICISEGTCSRVRCCTSLLVTSASRSQRRASSPPSLPAGLFVRALCRCLVVPSPHSAHAIEQQQETSDPSLALQKLAGA